MATIQIRDVPDDAYQLIHSQARARGQSLQAYMRQQIIQMVGGEAHKTAALLRLEEFLRDEGPLGLEPAELVAHLDADRR